MVMQLSYARLAVEFRLIVLYTRFFLFVLKFLHVFYRLPWYKIYSICIRKRETQIWKKIGRYCWTEIMFHNSLYMY